MSKLFLATESVNWQLNVISFSSPLFGMINSAQTKTMAVHFPIKCSQPEVQFTVQFLSENQFEDFQRFVRSHQQQIQYNGASKLVWLNWPERDIDNWTGMIRSFKAGGMRRNYAPHAQFSVDLVDSLLSRRTDLASFATPWQMIFGAGMGPDAVLGPPSAAEEEFAKTLGGTLFPIGQRFSSGSTAAPPSNTVPQFPSVTGGILPGS